MSENENDELTARIDYDLHEEDRAQIARQKLSEMLGPVRALLRESGWQRSILPFEPVASEEDLVDPAVPILKESSPGDTLDPLRTLSLSNQLRVLFGKKVENDLPPVQIDRVIQRTATDCMRCCLAMCIPMAYEHVPDFVALHGEGWFVEAEKWLTVRGMGILAFPGRAEESSWLPGWLPVIASGKSPRGDHRHAVVILPNQVIDPHLSEDGVESVDFRYVVVHRPWAHEKHGDAKMVTAEKLEGLLQDQRRLEWIERRMLGGFLTLDVWGSADGPRVRGVVKTPATTSSVSFTSIRSVLDVLMAGEPEEHAVDLGTYGAQERSGFVPIVMGTRVRVVDLEGRTVRRGEISAASMIPGAPHFLQIEFPPDRQ